MSSHLSLSSRDSSILASAGSTTSGASRGSSGSYRPTFVSKATNIIIWDRYRINSDPYIWANEEELELLKQWRREFVASIVLQWRYAAINAPQNLKDIMKRQHGLLETMASEVSCVRRYDLAHELSLENLARHDADVILDVPRLRGIFDWRELSNLLEVRLQDWTPTLVMAEDQ